MAMIPKRWSMSRVSRPSSAIASRKMSSSTCSAIAATATTKATNHPSTREIYAKRLVAEGVVTEADVDQMAKDFTAHLDTAFDAAKSYRPNKADWLEGAWTGLQAAS